MDTELANIALRHLGNSNEIANIATERSQEARAIRAFYNMARKTLMTEALWPFARKFEAAALISTDETAEWIYSYRYPSNCAFLHGIVLPNYRNNSIMTPDGYTIPFVETSDDLGLVILSNQPNAVFAFTRNDIPEQFWPEWFRMTFTYMLAYLSAASITGGDPFKLGVTAYQLYSDRLEKAKIKAFNEEASQPAIADGELVSVRY